MNQDLKKLAQLHDENIELKKEIEESYINGVLTGLKICKEMWAQGTISHENIYENEVYYKEKLKELNTSVKRLKSEREWISVKDRLPESCSIGDKVLLFRLVNESQSALSITVFDTNMVKYCSPSESWWMPLPDKPKQ